MKIQYRDLIEQTFDWPQEEFKSNSAGTLMFHDIDLMALVEQYGTPLKFTYLPKMDTTSTGLGNGLMTPLLSTIMALNTTTAM